MSTKKANTALYLPVALTYAAAFRGQPWNEAYKDQDGNFYGPEYDGTWEELGLQPAYPPEETAQYIAQELLRPDVRFASFPAQKAPETVAAAGWGYSSTAEELVLTKWASMAEAAQTRLVDLFSAILGNSAEPLWYVAEVFVSPDFQGQGLGTRIVQSLLANVAEVPVLLRTNRWSPMNKIARKCGFLRIAGDVATWLDPINADRVVYARGIIRSQKTKWVPVPNWQRR